MNDALGLTFACFDLARCRDGSLRFLEVNPSGQRYWVEHKASLPLLATMADVLQRTAERNRETRAGPQRNPTSPRP
jgi:hypothetical protein